LKAPTAAETDDSSSSQPADAPGQSFSGNGSKNLGTIHVGRDSVLEWTNDGPYFGVNDANFEIFINSEAHAGDSVVEAGTYRKVEVGAAGNWTIELRPR
jgi:hypothetical protein